MQKDISLGKDEYRVIPSSSLAPPGELKGSIAIFLGMSVFAAGATWWTGKGHLAFAVIPLAFMAGVAYAGLEPSYWFGRPTRGNTRPYEP